ncbi:hypothetical protein jhhlp_000366 [Lomentospora prolificans]|uniref:Piwi domain-containing protein n=1 Tax=Lomentospora prolificans TaxID=41688 RepID=A0A2N3NKP7_9PEZI|nr:hypothetical protein jhhlp_000366 [Lomentospora prolificans]
MGSPPHPGSQAGSSPLGSPLRGRSPALSRAGSTSGSPSAEKGKTPFGRGMGYDPAKPEQIPKNKFNSRVDLPPEAYMKEPIDNRFTKRPGFNTTGRVISVDVNQFAVTSINQSLKIYQYDISVTPVPKTERAVLLKCWNHTQVKAALAKYRGKWLYDGNKLACLFKHDEIRLHLDLDEGRPNNRGNNKVYFLMKKTTHIEMSALRAYLQGRSAWDNSVLECMNFLDHLIRQWPSERLLAIKRNFYSHEEMCRPLSGFNEVAIGAYASIRLCQSNQSGGTGLGVNVDIVNTAMWTGGQSLYQLINAYLPTVDRNYLSGSDISRVKSLRPVVDREGQLKPSPAFLSLKRFHKLKFTMTHQEDRARIGRGEGKEHTLYRFVWDPRYGPNGATAKNVRFEYDGRMVSVYEYFELRYRYQILFPQLPVIETTKKGCFVPLEVCWVKPMQRFPFKLGSRQTADMIRIAVTRPPVRKANIMQRFATLDYHNDPYLQQYGIKINSHFMKTEARLLKPPVIQFGNTKAEPGTSGRWDLRGKKFFKANSRELKVWGFVIFADVQESVVTLFSRAFQQAYTGHGGVIKGKPMIFNASKKPDCAAAFKDAHKEWQEKGKGPVDLMFCVLSKQGEDLYNRLKKSADCRFAVLTQMLIVDHVVKNNPQYHSNVCMKVNAKLGGATSRIFGQGTNPFYKVTTMVLGVDVSHSSPGIDAPSMASMVMSVDPDACRYAAAVETNGYKVELLMRSNINVFFQRLIPLFKEGVRNKPEHIYYFRDGVSEGQFAQVIEYEVNEMRDCLKTYGIEAKFTVIVATKRHHIRFFPDRVSGDRNSNPLPGTLVERTVTHPFHWDFYLCSHVAIQGTARPVHYHVILDEADCKPDDLQRMIYEQCYMYARSTTSVSLHPAVYYAHLASGRARTHEVIPTSYGLRTGGEAVREAIRTQAEGDTVWNPPRPTESRPLLAMGIDQDTHRTNKKFFPSTMWYI